MFLTLYRALRFALQGFWRNIWLSVVTIIILVLTIFSVSLVSGINVVGREAVNALQDKIDVSVYFFPEVSESDVQNVQYRLESLGSVKNVTYVSREQALADFREKHKGDQEIIDSLNQLTQNPLGATLVIKAKSVDSYPVILEVLDDKDYQKLIQDRNFEDNQAVIDKLADISRRVERAALALSAVFIIISILIIFNTIRITIYTHREEIGIMKLVGASNWFIRFPFVIESIFYAIIAVVISLALLYPFVQLVSPQLQSFFDGSNFSLLGYFTSHFLYILVFQLGFAIILSVISSAVAVGRYLRV